MCVCVCVHPVFVCALEDLLNYSINNKSSVQSAWILTPLMTMRQNAWETEKEADFHNCVADLLKEQHEFVLNEDTNEQAGLAVQHVRDQLLPPARRCVCVVCVCVCVRALVQIVCVCACTNHMCVCVCACMLRQM